MTIAEIVLTIVLGLVTIAEGIAILNNWLKRTEKGAKMLMAAKETRRLKESQIPKKQIKDIRKVFVKNFNGNLKYIKENLNDPKKILKIEKILKRRLKHIKLENGSYVEYFLKMQDNIGTEVGNLIDSKSKGIQSINQMKQNRKGINKHNTDWTLNKFQNTEIKKTYNVKKGRWE